METFLFILVVVLLLFIIFGAFIFYRFYEKFLDMESFVLNVNEEINQFKVAVDRVTKSNIMVYDELVFEVMNQCKSVKQKVDQFLTKYDMYGNYIYTEDVEKEEKKEIIGILHASPNRK